MNRFQKIELTLALIILAINIGFFIYLFDVGHISGFVLFEKNYLVTPHNFVDENEIIADKEKVVINIENPVLSRYENSDSMLPVLGEGVTGVGVIPKTEEDIRVGDIISFEQGGKIIVHRVIEKGIDNKGVYFITKGDNNNLDDDKIRFEDIDSVLVALVY